MARGKIRELPELSDKQIERFWSKVVKTNDCWMWVGTVAENGYGRFWVNDSNYAAHRIAYELMNSIRLDPELTIDHTCEVKLCVRHLRPATQRENILRSSGAASVNRSKTHCVRGHSLLGLNLYLTTSGKRECKTCRREAHKRHKLKKLKQQNERMMTYR